MNECSWNGDVPNLAPGYGESFCHKAVGETIPQWIGLREMLQESPICNGKIYGFRLRSSLKPIHPPSHTLQRLHTGIMQCFLGFSDRCVTSHIENIIDIMQVRENDQYLKHFLTEGVEFAFTNSCYWYYYPLLLINKYVHTTSYLSLSILLLALLFIYFIYYTTTIQQCY